jgi:hypothetical protein
MDVGVLAGVDACGWCREEAWNPKQVVLGPKGLERGDRAKEL